jgi:hypothetical protein
MKIPELTRRNQILIVLALLVVAIPSLFIYDYTQNNPKFCTTCHLMNEAYDTWEVSAMHDINCHACHETDMITSMDHVYEVLMLNPDDVTNLVEIENEMCEVCHATNDPQWLQVVNTAGHDVHFFGSDDHADCIVCHGMSLHVFRPPEEPCMECHDPERVHASEKMMADCLSCHDFIVNDDDLRPSRDDCIECHEDRSQIIVSLPVDAHIESTCTICHNPHGEVTSEDCSECHEVEGGLHEISLHSDCISCHVPHEAVAVRDSCETCHADRRDHYATVNCLSCHG